MGTLVASTAAPRIPLRTAIRRGALGLALAAWLPVAAAGAVPPSPAPGHPGAATPAPAAGTPASGAVAAPVPTVVPIEQVFRAADEVDEVLRREAAAARLEPFLEQIEASLAEAEPALAPLRVDLAPQRLAEASAREIERLRRTVARAEEKLAAAQAALEARSTLLAAIARDLEVTLASWRLTAEAARRDRAPAAVLRRVAQVEERLQAAVARVHDRRDRVVAVQGRGSELRDELARHGATLEVADAALTRELFEVESAPLWRALRASGAARGLGAQLRQGLRESGRDVAAFAAEERVRLALHLGLVVLLCGALLALRRPVAAMKAADPALAGADRVLARPGAAALLLSAPLLRWIYPPLPPTVSDLLALAFLAPLLRLLHGLLPEVFRRPLLGLAAVFAMDKLSALAPPRTLLSRVAVLVVTAAALAGLVRGLRRGGWGRWPRRGGGAFAARAGTAAALALLATSLVANVVGNATLAERLTHATLASAILGVVLLGVVEALAGALAALLHLPALRRRRLLVRHRELLRRRAEALLRAAAVAAWAWRTAVELGVAEGLASAGAAVLALRLRVGGLDVTLGNVVAFAVTLALGVGVARAVRFVLDEGVFPEVALPRGVPTAVSTTVQYVLLVLGFSWAVLASGMEMSRFSFVAGAVGVGVGFGLQNVVSNFVSGLILLYERPVQLGDLVEIGRVSGEVTRIGVRSSTVRTFSGAEVIVPNASLIAGEVTNWTLSDRRRRIDLAVSVAYDTRPGQVLELLLAAVRGRPGVAEDPAPAALFLRFGESALEFSLQFWAADADGWPRLASEVLVDVHARLGQAGIEIPFPQRDLHLRSVDPAAAGALVAAARDGEPLLPVTPGAPRRGRP